jgi:hypothetical protein
LSVYQIGSLACELPNLWSRQLDHFFFSYWLWECSD